MSASRIKSKNNNNMRIKFYCYHFATYHNPHLLSVLSIQRLQPLCLCQSHLNRQLNDGGFCASLTPSRLYWWYPVKSCLSSLQGSSWNIIVQDEKSTKHNWTNPPHPTTPKEYNKTQTTSHPHHHHHHSFSIASWVTHTDDTTPVWLEMFVQPKRQALHILWVKTGPGTKVQASPIPHWQNDPMLQFMKWNNKQCTSEKAYSPTTMRQTRVIYNSYNQLPKILLAQSTSWLLELGFNLDLLVYLSPPPFRFVL